MSKRYLLTEPAFIGAALLAAGSIITEDDLPVGPGPIDESTGKRGPHIRSAPPTSAIQVDRHGQPVDDEDLAALAGISLASNVAEIAPIAPHAPNPTMPQALPPHGVGEVQPAGTYVAAEGVQTAEQADLNREALAAQAVALPGAMAPAPGTSDTAPKRRGGHKPAAS